MTRPPKCSTCDGSGVIIEARSWFTADGYRRLRCGICGGTGFSTYHSPDYARQQQRMRSLAGAIAKGVG